MKTNKRKIFWIGVGACVFGLASGLTLIGTVMAEDKEPTSVDIQIDTLSYAADNLPNGIIGKSYPVFEMSATDNWGNAVDNVETLVFAPD